MNFSRRSARPVPEPKPALIERTPLTDAEIEALLADPGFVADYIEWRNAR